MIDRRVTMLGLAAAAACSALAQSPGRTYRIGYFGFTAYNSPEDERIVAAFVGRLRELGFVEGKNLVIEWRYAEGKSERYAAFAKEMVESRADLIVTGTATAARAVVQASKTMPVVTFGMPDPISTGLVASLAHPAGQVTGMSNFAEDLIPKRIELFKSAVPSLTKLAYARCPECVRLSGYSNATLTALFESYQAFARKLDVTFIPVDVNSDSDFPAAAEKIKREGVDGLLLAANQINAKLRRDWVAFQSAERIPLMSDYRASGALLSYGPDYAAMFKRIAEFAARILNGANPGDLPMEQPTMVELVINRGVAKALGLTIPSSVLLRADLIVG
ncbi:MAG TPA: ABC transporter substrate-binding protein [Acidobacteriaceae bacterium]|nr:ABC transporter substrate-binding protein [Acidobacteriaceae bacterium]